ncbi:MAG: UDP-N-acetyl-D-glucosamine dehydrogenase, partial [Solirubrobacteraceae bacterium]|nr:UDP-N-acetyl-D-glucosamine dehydrogenase [Solirubrobacteraceae bacterium]
MSVPKRSLPIRAAPYTGAPMTIGIMGLGYVGLPLAVAFAEEGHCVVALDTDTRKIDSLRRRESYVEDISDE